MVDVLLSYHRSDTFAARAVVAGLEQAGFSVWWDQDLVAGTSFQNVIAKEIQAAAAVVVLWSRHSVESLWVTSEADHAVAMGKLVPARIEDVRIPLGFLAINTANLVGWRGESDHPGWRQLLQAIFHKSKREPSLPASGSQVGQKVEVERGRSYSRPADAGKKQIFIAHANDDKPRLRGILSVLIEAGFRIWIDKPHRIGLAPDLEARISDARIRYGDDWKDSIKSAISRSDFVLALWSKTAATGLREQFHYEIFIGLIERKLRQGKIDPLTFEEIRAPYVFSQIADLSDYKTGEFHVELDYLIQDFA